MPDTTHQPYPARMILLFALIALFTLAGLSLILYMVLSGSSEPQALLTPFLTGGVA